MALRTPTEVQSSAQAQSQWARTTGDNSLLPLVGGFELAYSYTPSSGAPLTVGDLKLPEGVSVHRALELLQASGFVQWAHPDYIVSLSPEFNPNDPRFADQFNLPPSMPRPLGDRTQGSPQVLTAVIDTGVYWQHRDFYSVKPTAFPPPGNIASNIYFNSRDPVGDQNNDGNRMMMQRKGR